MAFELNKVYSAVGCGILVLLADWFFKQIDFQDAGFVRQLFFWDKNTAMRIKRIDKRYRERA